LSGRGEFPALPLALIHPAIVAIMVMIVVIVATMVISPHSAG
jgi:hypothetical protein